MYEKIRGISMLGVMRIWTIIFIFFSLKTLGQNSLVKGKIDNPFNDYSGSVVIYASPVNKDTIYQSTSDSLGNFHFLLPFGQYTFKFSSYTSITTSKSIDINTQKIVLTEEYPNCPKANRNGICSLCKNKDNVIVIDNHSINDLWFKTSVDSLHYYNSRDKLGYEIIDNKLVWVKKSSDDELLQDPCNHWFCKRHRTIF